MNRPRFLVLIVFTLLLGCESNTLSYLADDTGKQADIEEARIALDDGNYDKAIRLVEDDYNASSPDLEVADILASAYMGKAGLDLTYVLENIGAGDGSHFDIVASALSLTVTDQGYPASAQLAQSRALSDEAGERYITASSIAGLLESLENAQSILVTLIDYAEGRGADPDTDAVVQLGMASALHFIMMSGDIVSEVMGSNVPVNRAAYQEIFPEDTDWLSLLNETASYIDANPDDLSALKSDLANVYDAVQALIENIGLDEDITGELDGFIRDLLGVPESAPDQTVVNAINAYTGADFAEFVYTELLSYD